MLLELTSLGFDPRVLPAACGSFRRAIHSFKIKDCEIEQVLHMNKLNEFTNTLHEALTRQQLGVLKNQIKGKNKAVASPDHHLQAKTTKHLKPPFISGQNEGCRKMGQNPTCVSLYKTQQEASFCKGQALFYTSQQEASFCFFLFHISLQISSEILRVFPG